MIEVFCDWAMVFLFPFVRTKEKETKRKSAGYAPELKNHPIFLNEKNSLRSNSFSFLTENTRFFFTLLHWGRRGPPLEGTSLRSWCGCTRDPSLRFAPLWMTNKMSEAKKKTPHPQRAKRCCAKKAQRSGLTFWAWSGGAFRSVKNKKLFERQRVLFV